MINIPRVLSFFLRVCLKPGNVDHANFFCSQKTNMIDMIDISLVFANLGGKKRGLA